MPTTSSPLPHAVPAATWKALAHLVAARPKIRIWNPATAKFDRTKDLTTRLPPHPAAALLYQHGRTHLLALDFDTKHHGQHTVDTDFTRALSWITDAGGVAVTDQSSSGGRHILVPLAHGTTATLPEISQLMRLLEARLPSLDKTPMTNPTTGCITVPGSPCREGGHRRLDGPLADAVAAFTTGSNPALLPRLAVLLGALPTPPTPAPAAGQSPTLTGVGDHTRLRDEYTRGSDPPDRITTYASTGRLPPGGPWPTHSEARQSVLAHAVLHGHSLASVRALMAPGRPWHPGLAAAYARYGRNADKALHRDFDKALSWTATHIQHFRPSRAQEQVHTRGSGPAAHRRWLTHAVAWLDREYPRHRYRWIGAAVYQALAIHAVRAGEIVNGVPVVGVGGRSLSIAAGLLAETTVWEFLRDTRDRPGSPLLRTRVAQSQTPDYYALIGQNRTPTTARAQRCRIEDVHSAWKVIGHRHRRVYELVAYHDLNKPQEIFAAAHVSASTGYNSLSALETAGLIVRQRGHIRTGPTSLDDIAAAHEINQHRAARIQRHQRERAAWHTWLARRDDERSPIIEQHQQQHQDDDVVAGVASQYTGRPTAADSEYLAAVLATGPPAGDDDDEEHALRMLTELMGAQIVCTVAGPSRLNAGSG